MKPQDLSTETVLTNHHANRHTIEHTKSTLLKNGRLPISDINVK